MNLSVSMCVCLVINSHVCSSTVGSDDHHSSWAVSGISGSDQAGGLAGRSEGQGGLLYSHAEIHQSAL